MTSKISTRITIEDVAERAGVSVMTVSRLLNDTGPVSDKTAVKIRAAVLELNYIPHQGARALAAHNIPIDPNLVAVARFDEETAVFIVTQWLNEGIVVDAIFAADDVSARGVMRAMQAAGQRVPNDIAVVGFDDALLSQYTDPPLTTVRAPIEEAGRAAATQLIRLIQGEPTDSLTLLPTELVIRQSCGWQNGRSS